MEKKKIVITNPGEESLKFNLGYKDLIIELLENCDTFRLKVIYSFVKKYLS